MRIAHADGRDEALRYHRVIANEKEMMGTEKSSSAVQSVEFASESRVRRPLRIALFGFGTVGSSVARILVESKPEGLELTHVFNRNVARKKVDWAPPASYTEIIQ